MYNVPCPASHLVGKTWRTELFADAYPSELAFVVGKEGVDLLTHQRERWHPSAKKHVRPLSFRSRVREHVAKTRKQTARLNWLIPRG
jgi:hypothetical protein